MASPRTLFDKIWDNHVIAPQGEGTYLIYIDLHLIHEVTTPQAFEGMKLAGRKVRRAKLYYLRGLTGKKARIAERGRETVEVPADGEVQPAEQQS